MTPLRPLAAGTAALALLVCALVGSAPASAATQRHDTVSRSLRPAALVWARPLRESDRIITTAQLHELYRSFAGTADTANENAWVDVRATAIGCMVGKGFYVDPRIERQDGSIATPAAARAFDGVGVTPYRWQNAGCYGAAVHVLGLDNAH